MLLALRIAAEAAAKDKNMGWAFGA